MAICNLEAQRDLSELSPGRLKSLGAGAERLNDAHMAILYYSVAVEKLPEDYKTLLKLAKLEASVRNYGRALELYTKMIELDAEREPTNYYERAQMLKNLGIYEEAKTEYADFIKKYKRVPELKPYKKSAEIAMGGCDSALVMQVEQLNVELKRLDNSVNGPHIEFNPIMLDQNTLVYGALAEKKVNQYHLDSLTPTRKFYVAKKENEEWKSKGEWGELLNTPTENTGNGCYNLDKTKFFFSRCAEDWRGKMQCKLYVTDVIAGKFAQPVLLDETINTPGSSNSQPAIGKESRKGYEVLYFVSDREGGKGGTDIWASVFDGKKNRFKTAKNIGKKVNTPGNEVSPFIEAKTKKLYFSSDGQMGLGGLDIFETRGEYRTWIIAKNVGYPINTNVDELYFRTTGEGDEGFFTSNRSGGNQMFHAICCDDIYAFKFRDFLYLGVEGKIVEVPDSIYVQGSGDALAKNTKMPALQGATMKLYLKEGDEEVEVSTITSDFDGSYFLPLEEEHEYRLEVTKPGYFSNFVDFSTVGKTFSDTLFRNIGLSELDEKSIVIPSIYYDFDSAALTAEAQDKLRSSILVVLQENPLVRIELSSHTDSEGKDSYNRKLSQKRAESVVDFLVANGIEKKRLTPKGYGESKPIADNKNKDGSDNPEGRQKNRRTEFKVTGVDKAKVIVID